MHRVFLLGLLFLLAPAARGAAVDLFLVADIDTTGEPIAQGCNITCPELPLLYGSLPFRLQPFGDRLLLVANDRTHGWEPWISDGTAEGTRLLADLCPGECSSNAWWLGPVGERWVFAARSEEKGLCGLFATDGEEVRRLLQESIAGWVDCSLSPYPPFGDPFLYPAPAVGDGRLFLALALEDESRPSWLPVTTLLATDGTPEGTVAISELEGGVGIGELIWRHGQLFLSRAGRELWKLDLASGEGARVAEVCEEAGNRGLGMFPFDDLILIAAPCLASDPRPPGEHEFRAYILDPVTLATTLLAPEAPGFGGESTVVSGGWRFYRGLSGVWITDGTAQGTRLLADTAELAPVGPVAGGIVARGPGGALVFLSSAGVRRDLPGRVAHWAFSGFAPVDGRGIYPGYSEPPSFGAWEVDPWITDGTPHGTWRLVDVDAGTFEQSPVDFTRVGDLVYFTADIGGFGRELWAIRLADEAGQPLLPPSPPGDEWIASDEFPGFRFQVRITPTAVAALLGRHEADCQPDTVCVSGALPGRSEVFLRILGPRPNGYLWPTIVRFTPSKVEVWIERGSGQDEPRDLRYYHLEAVAAGEGELGGLQDRFGFLP